MCEEPSEAEKRYGLQVATSLRRRLADLLAAANIHDLVIGGPYALDGGSSKMAVHLYAPYQLIIANNHKTPVQCADGTIDWRHVDRIKIIDIIIAD